MSSLYLHTRIYTPGYVYVCVCVCKHCVTTIITEHISLPQKAPSRPFPLPPQVSTILISIIVY